DFAHASVALQTLEAGIPTFCEKPMAISVEDTDAMLALAKEKRARLYIGHNMRHMPVVRQMKEIVDSGRIGRVRAIWCRHFVGAGGDFYFKDWHAERAKSMSLLLQKGAQDIDVIHWLAGGYTRRVPGIGDLAVYGDITHRRDNSHRRKGDWFDACSWPPTPQQELHPVLDVEDISMIQMRLANGVLASYQQCHFTPDYFRNYTVIGDAGRIENMGDGSGHQIHIWESRRSGPGRPDAVEVIARAEGGHGGADPSLIAELLDFVRHGGGTRRAAGAAREAAAHAGRGDETAPSAGAASPPSPPAPPARPSPPGCTARSRSAAVARRTTCRPCRRTCDGTSTTGRREAGSPTGTRPALVPSGSPPARLRTRLTEQESAPEGEPRVAGAGRGQAGVRRGVTTLPA